MSGTFLLQNLSLMVEINLIAFFLIWLLDLLKAEARQKLLLLKISLIASIVAPLTLGLLKKLTSGNPVNIQVPLNLSFSKIVSQTPISRYHTIDWDLVVSKIYLTLLALFFLRFLFLYLKTTFRLSDSELTEANGTSVYLNYYIKKPFSFGFLNPRIYFPLNFKNQWTEIERNIALTHEKTHIRHHDCQWKFISLAIRTFLFFLPTAYALHKKLDLEMEILCDAETCKETKVTVYDYGQFLISALQHPSKEYLATYLTDSNIKRRIFAMKSRTIQRNRLAQIFSFSLILASITAAAAGANLTDKKKEVLLSVQIFKDGTLISSPRILLLDGDEGSISQTDTKGNIQTSIKMTADIISKANVGDMIKVAMQVDYMNDGKMMHATPKIVTTPGEKTTMSLGDQSGENMTLSMVAEER